MILRPRWEKVGHDYLLTSSDLQHLVKVSSAGKMRYNIEIDGMRTTGRVHGLIQACEEAEKRLARAIHEENQSIKNEPLWTQPSIDSGPVRELIELIDEWRREGVLTCSPGSPADRVIKRVKELL